MKDKNPKFFTPFCPNAPTHSDRYHQASPERRLVCKIIERAALDYLKDMEDAVDFFFGEGLPLCEAYFDKLEIDCDDFRYKLRRFKFEGKGNLANLFGMH